MQGLDSFKTATGGTAGNRNMAPMENAKISNKSVLQETGTTSLINRICTQEATNMGHVMRIERLEQIVTTEMIEGKISRGKQLEKMLKRQTM